MATEGFSFYKRPDNHPNERIESFNENPNILLKKFNGSETEWPSLSKIQFEGQSHQSQQEGLISAKKDITAFFTNYY